MLAVFARERRTVHNISATATRSSAAVCAIARHTADDALWASERSTAEAATSLAETRRKSTGTAGITESFYDSPPNVYLTKSPVLKPALGRIS